MTTEKVTESKITRQLFKMNCPRCKKEITGTSRKTLNHNFKVHALFCKGVKK